MRTLHPNWYNAVVFSIRTTIRKNRDTRGDDRCWLDDYLVWSFLRDEPVIPILTLVEKMIKCTQFYDLRRSEIADRMPDDALLNINFWDQDLEGNTSDQLGEKQDLLLAGIQEHYETSLVRPLTIEDDRKLYSLLPEKMPADFRLPPRHEFLGRAKAGAGCPNFWDSHAACHKACNLHQWGPCK